MTARTAGFITRAEAGLVAPRSRSRNITPGDGGVAVHYGGPGKAPATLAGALTMARQWQRFHMGTHGWADLAYTLLVSQTGHVIAGRGIGVRTAAQGTNPGNDDYYAVCWLGGADGAPPTQEAKDAVEWAVKYLREEGGAGNRVRSHRTFHSTACAGNPLTELAERLDRKAISTAPKPAAPKPAAPATPPDRTKPLPRLGAFTGPHLSRERNGGRFHGGVLKAQRNLRLLGAYTGRLDGKLGPQTEAALVRLQRARGIKANGVLGPQTWAELERWS